ncbi:MAG: dihydropteroate synthase [Prevotellaceae bacterium]|jgi:dihydropteroate synthase|nr:dihydropteroate synthase [Prevotellaceae bacterium]
MKVTPFILICGGHRLLLNVPRVMGIINITADSFYAESRCTGEYEALQRVEQMVRNGTDIVDIGAYSTRPDASEVGAKEEKARLAPIFKAITRNFPNLILSVDTFRAGVVKYLYERYGAFIVNDVTAGAADRRMISFVVSTGLPYIIMHTRGTPQTMQQLTDYKDVVGEVIAYLRKKLMEVQAAGIQQVIIDPGFGFAKTVEQNHLLFNHLKDFKTLNAPLMIGISRKSMIYKPLKITPNEALNATSALHLQALLNGASILRVHDVAEAVQVVKLYQYLSTNIIARNEANANLR